MKTESYPTYTEASARVNELRMEGATATVLDRRAHGDPTCKFTVQYEEPTPAPMTDAEIIAMADRLQGGTPARRAFESRFLK